MNTIIVLLFITLPTAGLWIAANLLLEASRRPLPTVKRRKL